jgi:hypothetical protein
MASLLRRFLLRATVLLVTRCLSSLRVLTTWGVHRIQDKLLHSLDSHSSNWTTAVQAHALSLLRSGEVSTFPALIRRVLEDVRHETASVRDGGDHTNGAPATNGSSSNKKGVNGDSSSGAAAAAEGSLAVPPAVVEAALKVARDSLEEVCEVEDGKSR